MFLPRIRICFPSTALLAVALIATLLGLASIAAPPAAPPDPAIAFALNGDLAVMNADGQNQTVILNPDGRVNDSSWSPDLDGDATNGYQGSLVFERQFVENSATKFDLWIIDVVVSQQGVSGANLRNLATSDTQNPAWSPTGDRIAFDGAFNANQGVFVVSAAGGDPALVLADPADGFVGWPAWNPAGTHLAIARKSNGIYSLVIKQVIDESGALVNNGAETVVIPTESGFTWLVELDWSRSGDRIAFRGEGNGLSKSIYVVEAVASGLFSSVPSTQVSTSQAGFGPTWSPDDAFLVYSESARTGPARTLLVRQNLSTGEEATLIDRKREHAVFPAWRRP